MYVNNTPFQDGIASALLVHTFVFGSQPNFTEKLNLYIYKSLSITEPKTYL